jgi:CHAD domain-containing protein
MTDSSAIEMLRGQLERQLRMLERSEGGVRSGSEVRDLHRFRVALRRSRSLIRASRPLLRDQLAALERELRWLARVSGPVRDLDVLIDHLHELREDLEPDQAGVELIIGSLERERIGQRLDLVEALESERYRELILRFETELPRLTAFEEDASLRRNAVRELVRLRVAYEELGSDPPDEELHALRLKAKHARYATELAARQEPDLATLVEALKTLQDLAGAHQDASIAAQRVRTLATDDSALAAGRIVEHEHQRCRAARARLVATWKEVRRAAEVLE